MVQVLYLFEIFIFAHYFAPPSTETPTTTIVRCHKNSWIYLTSTYYWWLLRPTIAIRFDSKFQLIAQLFDSKWKNTIRTALISRWPLTFKAAAKKLHPPSPFFITEPECWYLFYRPTEGRRLSWPSWLVAVVVVVVVVVIVVKVAVIAPAVVFCGCTVVVVVVVVVIVVVLAVVLCGVQ